MAIVEGPVGNFSYDALRFVLKRLVRQPVLQDRLAADVARRAGTTVRRRQMAKLLSSDEAFELIIADDADGMGLLLGPATKAPADPRVLGRAAIMALRDHADRATQLMLALLAQGRTLQEGQSVLFEQLGQLLEAQRHDRQQESPTPVGDPRAPYLRATKLEGRDHDISRLRELILAASGYLVVVGDPWAGKTAVMAEVAVDPPADWDVVSFFVREVSRRNTAGDFLEVVNRQLGELLGESVDGQDLIWRRVTFEHLWPRAVARAERCRRQLVLLVDGLDEQDGRAEVPISAVLPTLVSHWAKVVVATRPNPRRPREMDASHPYHAACDRPELIAPSHAALEIGRRATDTILSLATQPDPRTRSVLALLTVADGPLTEQDVVDLVDGDRFELRTTMAALERNLIGDGSPERPWELGHVELLRTARTELGRDRPLLDEAERRIDAWSDAHHNEGWPEATPAYLLVSYPSMLVRRRLPRRLAWLVSDEHEARVRAHIRTTGGLVDAVTAALALYDDPARPIDREDIDNICTLGLRRTELLATAAAIPAGLVAGWAELGAWDEADRLLTQITDDQQLAHVLEALPNHVDRAYQTIRTHLERIVREPWRSMGQGALAVAMVSPDPADGGMRARAERLADGIDGLYDMGMAFAGIAAAVACVDPLGAQRVVARAEEAAEPLDVTARGELLTAIAMTMVHHDPPDRGLLERAEQILYRVEDLEPEDGAELYLAMAFLRNNPADAGLLAHAEWMIDDLNDEVHAAEALVDVASIIVQTNPAAAERLVSQAEQLAATEHWQKSRAERAVAVAIAQRDPTDSDLLAHAVQLAKGIEVPEQRCAALAGIAAVVLPADPCAGLRFLEQAELATEGIEPPVSRCSALAEVATLVGPVAPSEARRILSLAEMTTRANEPWAAGHGAFADVALATVRLDPTDPERVAAAVRIAGRLIGLPDRARTLAEIGAIVAQVDGGAARGVLSQAEQLVERIDTLGVGTKALLDIAAAVVAVDASMAQRTLARAEQLVRSDKGPDSWRRDLLHDVAAAAAQHLPTADSLLVRAQKISEGAAIGGEEDDLIAALAVAAAQRDPDQLAQAELIVRHIDDPHRLSRALAVLAATITRSDPDTARTLLAEAVDTTEQLDDTPTRCEALAEIVAALARYSRTSRDLLAAATTIIPRIEALGSSTALERVARAMAHRVPMDADLAQQVEHIVERVDRSEDPWRWSWALADAAIALAEQWPADPAILACAERIADRLKGDEVAVHRVLVGVAGALARYDPHDPAVMAHAHEAAERSKQLKVHAHDDADALIAIARGMVEHDPTSLDLLARAEEITASITRPRDAHEARAAIAAALAKAPSTPGTPQFRATWAFLARLARRHGLGDDRVLSALVALGGDAGCQAVVARLCP